MLNKFAAIVCIVDVSAIRFDVLSSSSGVDFYFSFHFDYEQDDDNTNWMANDILDNFLGAMKHTIFYTLYLFVMTINTEKRKKKYSNNFLTIWSIKSILECSHLMLSIKIPQFINIDKHCHANYPWFRRSKTHSSVICVCVSCLFETVATAVHKIIIITRFGQKHIYSPWCASSLWCHRTTWLCGNRMGN